MSDIKVGDLVKLRDPLDHSRQIGVVVALSPRMVHIVSHGRANVIQVYWPVIQETDWEYDFFLEKFEEPDLTKKTK